MALHLILRNSTKIQGLNLSKTLLKFTPITATTNNLLWTHHQPQILIKNVNQSKLSLVPQVRSMSSDHGKLWTIEKAVSVGLLGIVPVAIAYPSPATDILVAVATVAHIHWGFEAIVIDYVRPVLFGDLVPKLSLGLLYLISAATLGGLIYYSTNDIGIGQTIRKLWTITQQPPQEVVEEVQETN